MKYFGVCDNTEVLDGAAVCLSLVWLKQGLGIFLKLFIEEGGSGERKGLDCRLLPLFEVGREVFSRYLYKALFASLFRVLFYIVGLIVQLLVSVS